MAKLVFFLLSLLASCTFVTVQGEIVMNNESSTGTESSDDLKELKDTVTLLHRQLVSLGEEKNQMEKEMYAQNNQFHSRLSVLETNQLHEELSKIVGLTSDLKNRVSVLEKKREAKERGKSAVYIRWGRTVCPANSTKIYSGYMAGVHHSNQGGTSDRLCLPDHPQWEDNGYPATGWDVYPSFIYGVETDIKNGLSTPFGIKNMNEQDVPCSVCLTPGRPTHSMFPALTQCPEGWTMEYKGYMMASYSGSGRPQTAAVCLDQNPEFIPGGSTVDNQGIIYILTTKCGSLPCPPYREREIACIICTL